MKDPRPAKKKSRYGVSAGLMPAILPTDAEKASISRTGCSTAQETPKAVCL